MFLRKLKNRFTKLISKLISFEQVQAILLENRIAAQTRAVVMLPTSRFYVTTSVCNLQDRPEAITIAGNAHIKGELLVFRSGGTIKIGDYSFIGEGSRIWSAEAIHIGNHVLISHNVCITDTNAHEMDYLQRAEGFKTIVGEAHPREMKDVSAAPVFIDDYAWINFGAIILKGVTIGKGAIVAAGSIVTKDVAAFTMVAGNPAVKIKDLKV
jgi:acetyltransferase-like isoleucine patch superfamily enzyme